MSIKVLFDYQIFSAQAFGGISNYFCKIYDSFLNDNRVILDLPIKYSNNKHLLEIETLQNKIYDDRNPTLSKFKKTIFGKKRYLKSQIKFNQKLANQALAKQDFDIFHPTYYDPYFLDKLGTKPFVINIHDLTYQVFPELFKLNDKIYENMKLLANKATRVISVSNGTKKDLINIFGIEEKKIEVIYHGSPFEYIDVSKIPTDPTKYNLPNKYLLFIGNRWSYKNFYFFIQAVSKILLNDDNLKLVCAGPELTNSELKFISNIGLSNKIIHYAATNDQDLAMLYKNALAFVFPSLYEGFGLPILEAFSCGCPVIASNTSSLPEIAQSAAVYFEPKNYSSIENAVSKVVSDKDLRLKMKEAGYERLKDFSWQKTREETIKLYQSII